MNLNRKTNNPFRLNPNRRRFLAGLMPVCALSFFNTGSAWAFAQPGQDEHPEKHKFDRPFGHELSQRIFFKIQYGEFMELAAAIKEEWGEDRFIDFLKKRTAEGMLEYGRKQAEKMGKNDFQSYVDQFKGPKYDGTLTMKIVEDTPTSFKIEVSECLWARTFLDAKMGDIGFAHVCYGDYSWPQGFNPKIKMVRDKTLMQGHHCCNHHYIWQD
ncbi:MAG: L-2-amino-thiazoline-4-carboxylic acid hydrolase [Planctomycetes bacterium]|nr:L-2-amino-thiazoline-4-carboxylic acid hydrolase [Planctomycetota bacterium]